MPLKVKTRGKVPPPPKTKNSSKQKTNQALNALIAKGAPLIGASLGSLVGQPTMGSMLGTTFSKLMGFGDYTISSNSLIPSSSGHSSRTTAPRFVSNKNSIRVIEREYIGDVISGPVASVFQNKNYPINPSNPTSFPWLSKIAKLYDQWEPHGIVFEFVSTSSSYSATQALGTVVMATGYDGLDLPYTNKQVMENADFANSTRSCDSALHGLECDPAQRPIPLLYTSQSTSNPPNFSLLGNFQVATVGVPLPNTNLGELWVSYDISFYKKALDSPISDAFFNITDDFVSGFSPFPSPTVSPLSSLNITVVNQGTTGTTFTFPPNAVGSKFLVTFYYTCSSVQSQLATWSLLGMTRTNFWQAASLIDTVGLGAFWITIDSSSASFFVPSIASAAANKAITLSIVPVPPLYTAASV